MFLLIACILLFDLCLLGLFGPAVCFPNSSSPVLSLGLYSCCFGFSWPISSLLGSFVPFYSFGHPQPFSSLSGSFVPFYSFRHPRPVSSLLGSFVPFGLLCPICFPFTLPWAFTNFIGLPRPNYLILILGAHGLAINPLLSLFSLLWACRGPFSLFHIIYCPWFAFSLFPGSLRPIYLFKTHLFISWACDPLFLPFGLNGFFSIY